MPRGYQSYRGRRSKGKTALIAALLLILLAACVYIFIQRYIVYTDDGKWHFDIPFLSATGEEEENSPPDDGTDSTADDDNQSSGTNMNLVVEPSGDDTDDNPPPDDTPPQAPVRRLKALSGLPTEDALNQLLAETGASGVVYTIRDNTGRVFYDSAAAQTQAAQRAVTPDALSALCARENVYTVARFNCFHDSYYASVHMEDAGICQSSGYIWSDQLSYYWLDPAKEDARQYVVSLAEECVMLGFDELMLEELSYPVGGNQSRIDYSGNTLGKTEALVLFLQELRDALSAFRPDIQITMLIDPALLTTGSDETSGQDLTALLPLVDAVYVQTDDLSAAQALLAQYTENPPPLIPITAEAGDLAEWYLTE